MIENVVWRFGLCGRGDGFGYKYARFEEFISFGCCEVYQFFNGKDYLKEIYTEKKMKNIIICIILDINRKYIGLDGGCCSVSVLFEEDGPFKKRRYFDERIWVMRWM